MKLTNKKNPTITRTLLCELSDEERRDYGIKLAVTLDDIEKVETEKKASNDHFKNRIAGLAANADELKRTVATGKEWREVECEVELCKPDSEHKQIVRLDTFEVIATEWMTSDEMQPSLLIDNEEEQP